MKKRLIPTLLGAGLLIASLTSCASTPSTGSSSTTAAKDSVKTQGNLIIRGANSDPSKLAKNDVLSITTKVQDPVYFEYSDWSKIRIVSDLLDELKLHEELTNEEKYKLMCYIFDDLPKNGKDGIAREVRLGKFFENGKDDDANLCIRVGVLTPGADAVVENEKIILLYTNALKMNNGEVLRGAGMFMNFDRNVTLMVGYNNNMLTEGNDIKSAELNQKETKGLPAISGILLAQQILADESLENDIKALEICDEVLSVEQQPAEKIMAMLMKYNYYIAQEDVDNAQTMWDEIIEFCPNVPGDMTPENLEAMNGECLYLLKALKADKAAAMEK